MHWNIRRAITGESRVTEINGKSNVGDWSSVFTFTTVNAPKPEPVKTQRQVQEEQTGPGYIWIIIAVVVLVVLVVLRLIVITRRSRSTVLGSLTTWFSVVPGVNKSGILPVPFSLSR